MSESWAVEYRPSELSISTGEGKGIIGQDLTVKILERQIETNSIKHAYLFAGSSGAGKTTIARAFANALNKGVGSPIEIDAASNNGVDNIRGIIQSSTERALQGKYKIFIIDECHALTSQAWQAFLKGIEEPPEYTIYMFATTEPNKIPATILNRVQRFNIQSVSSGLIYKRLEYISKQKGLANYQSTIDMISKLAGGCMRDAITNLERCASLGNTLNINTSREILGEISYEPVFKLTWALRDKNEEQVISAIDSLDKSGVNMKQLVSFYTTFILDLQEYNIFKDISLTHIPAYLASNNNPVVQSTVNFDKSKEFFQDLCDTLLDIKLNIKYEDRPKDLFSLYLLRFIRQHKERGE